MEEVWDVWAKKGQSGGETVFPKLGRAVCLWFVMVPGGKTGAADRSGKKNNLAPK